ncbi:MAG TPA: DinB family protein [Humibacter sp.]|nr:DinB family protein [Humibacter sp.]
MTDPELATLLRYLDAQRQHVLGAIEGLDDEQLRRAVLPSGWSCLQLIRHLTFDEEHFWFRCVVAGEPEAIARTSAAADDFGWRLEPGATAERVIADYRDAIQRSNAIIAERRPEDAPAWWPADQFGDWRIDTLRQIMLHLIAEVACHAGHLDAVRELIDGRQWLVLTE